MLRRRGHEKESWSHPMPEGALSAQEETLLQAAAERGDVFASWRLGRALLSVDGQAQEARHWLTAAARGGHREARIRLAWLDAGRKLYRSHRKPKVDQWFRRTAASGGYLASMAGTRGRHGEALLRELAAAGDAFSARYVAIQAGGSGDTDAQMRWYARAAELGDGVSALLLGQALEQQGKLEEAEDVYRRAAASADASSRHVAAARYELRELLRRQGKPVPADLQHAEPPPPLLRGDPTPTIVATAVVTTALVPFIQTLATKAAEEAYGAARSLISRLLHSDQRATAPPPSGPVFYVLQDPQSGTHLELRTGRLDDEALHALTLTDLEALAAPDPAGGTVTIRWDDSVGLWRRHVDDTR
ncbi:MULTISPECIES: hypothetical protein [unclassified Streptomyces]|uniref:hypothetical protein n=1 Tax=unclassified Streptomyces TaxID=2593676 RepID=UPI0036E7D0A7